MRKDQRVERVGARAAGEPERYLPGRVVTLSASTAKAARISGRAGIAIRPQRTAVSARPAGPTIAVAAVDRAGRERVVGKSSGANGSALSFDPPASGERRPGRDGSSAEEPTNG
jgi:hypothetical protein